MRSTVLLFMFSFCSLHCSLIKDDVEDKPLLVVCSHCSKTLHKEDIQVKFPCEHIFHDTCGFADDCRQCKPLPTVPYEIVIPKKSLQAMIALPCLLPCYLVAGAFLICTVLSLLKIF